MNRRYLMRFLGFVPAVPIVAVLPAMAAPARPDFDADITRRLALIEGQLKRGWSVGERGPEILTPSKYFDVHVTRIEKP